MRGNAVGRRRRNQNQLTDAYNEEICLRAVLSRRLLSQVFCAEHHRKTNTKVISAPAVTRVKSVASEHIRVNRRDQLQHVEDPSAWLKRGGTVSAAVGRVLTHRCNTVSAKN